MIFEGRITQLGTSIKPSSKLSSRAFDVVKNVDSATHLRIKGTNEFVEINENLIIKRKKRADGTPVNDEVHYTQINNQDEFVCVREGKESVIDGQFYTHVTFMKKSEKGSYLRCDDGVYVHKREVQVPAYKKIPLNSNTQLNGPVHNGEFYVQLEEVVLPNGTRLTLPNDRVKQEGEKWVYTDDNGDKFECSYKKNVDNRKRVEYILLDDKKIVNIKKLETQKNGEIVINDVDGETVVVGKKEISLDRPFVESSSYSSQNYDFYANNIDKQRSRINQKEPLRFDLGDNNYVQVNTSRTWAKVYNHGKKEVYVIQGERVPVLKDGEQLIFVEDFNIVELGNGRVRIQFMENKKEIAQNVEFKNGKLNSYMLNDRKITNIKWSKVGGFDEISSYAIDGVELSDVEWEVVTDSNGKSNKVIKSCKLHLVDENGNTVIEEIDDIKSSKYKHFAITYNLTNEITDIQSQGDTFSFKMGDYRFKDVQITADGQVGKCKLIYDGKEEEIDLNTDERFKQLKLAVKVSLDQNRVIPLIRSQLLKKEDGKYQLAADVVQTEEMKETIDPKTGKLLGGVASATILQDVGHAVKEQEKFMNNPFKTVVVDDKNPNKTHTISDFKTTYEGAADFDLDNNIIPDMIGKTKVTIKKGDIEIDKEKADHARDDLVVLGFALCSNPITLIFGIPILFTGATVGIVAPMIRGIKKARIKHQNPEKTKKKIQDKAAEHCKKNINTLVANCKRELNACKKVMAQEEYARREKEILESFRFNYHQEVAKLQILGGGEMKCDFDPSQKAKMIPTSHLAYLEYLRKRKEFEQGKEDSPRLRIEMNKQLEGLTGNDRIEKQVELWKLYGGRASQMNAYLYQMNNIELFLDRENKARKVAGLKGISKEDFEKKLKREFNEGKMVWGSIEDKLDAFQNTVEFQSQSKKIQREMLRKKREELESQAKKIKVDSITFSERLDKKGNPVIEKYTQSTMAYLEYVEQSFAMGNTHIKEKFTLDFYQKLSKKEQEQYYTSTSLSEASARRIKTTTNRRMEYDKKVNDTFVSLTETKQKEVAKKVEILQDDGERYRRIRDYEKLFKLSISLQLEEEKFNQDCENIKKRIENMPHAELLGGDEVKKAQTELDALRVRYAKQHKLATNAKNVMAKQYNMQVRDWALEEFAQAHKIEFALHEKYIKRITTKDSRLDQASIELSFFQSMCQNKEKSESYKNEFETYKVKHHVEENIEAETFCEMNDEEFKKFIEERNAKSTTGVLDPNSEMARCYFYAHCKKENPLGINKFKRYFAKKITEKAKERVQNNTLVKHDKKIIKSKGARKTAEMSQASVSSSVAPATAGLTA